MTKNSLTLTNKISNFIFFTFTFLLPIFIIPFSTSFLDQSKSLLLILLALLTVFLYLIRSFQKKCWEFIISPITLPLVLFTIITLASCFLTQNYPVKNLLGMGSIYLAFALIAMTGGILLKGHKLTNKIINLLSLSSIVLSITIFLQFLGAGPSHLINQIAGFNLPHNLLFNLSGSSFIAAQFILVTLILNLAQIAQKRFISTMNLISLPILVLSLGLSIWSLLPGQIAKLTLPPVSASWSIALDSLRQPKAALIGQGPESYTNIYKRYKPLWINNQDYWQYIFNSGTNLPLTLLVQLGFIGCLIWLLLFFQFFKKNTRNATKESPLTWGIIACFIIQLLTPANIVILGIQAILIAFWTNEFQEKFARIKLEALNIIITLENNLKRKSQSNTQEKITLPLNRGLMGQVETDSEIKTKQPAEINKFIILVINSAFIFLIVFIAYTIARAHLSYFYMFRASQALVQKNTKAVYDMQKQAVMMNPFLDANRRDYALTNLQIAIALSNKTDLSDQEKQQVVDLIKQAWREARAAVILDAQDSLNWLALAQVYQSLIGSDEQAPQWALDSLVKAAENDPLNPLIRTEIGSLFFSQGQYQQAVNFYQQAINLKPDLPMPYYQLSRCLVSLEKYQEAKQVLQQALNLLPAESTDIEIVKKDLMVIDEKIQEQTEKTTEQEEESSKANDQKKTSLPDKNIAPITEENLNTTNESLINEPANVPLDVTDIPALPEKN